MSRVLIAIAAVFALIGASVGAIAAQGSPEATGSPLAELGYPEVTITATEAGFELPAEVESGVVQLTLVNNAPVPSGFSLIQLPEGVTPEDIMPPADASPPVGPQPLPPALYDAVWAGGAFAAPGESSSSVVSLTAGQWLVVPPPDLPVPPAMLTVTGDSTGTIEAPEGAIAVELDNFQIRLPDRIPAGSQVLHLSNVGEQPHEMIISRTPERLTVEQAEALLAMAPDAEPDPSLPSLEEVQMVAFAAPVSQDQAALVEVDLAPGHYVAVCFIPEMESGEAHASHGMVTVFSVGAEGEQVEPPASPVPDEQASH